MGLTEINKNKLQYCLDVLNDKNGDALGLRHITQFEEISKTDRDKYRYYTSIYLHAQTKSYIAITFQHSADDDSFISITGKKLVERKEIITSVWV